MKPATSVRTPHRIALLAGGRAAVARPAPNGVGRFSRFSDDDLRNPRLSARERVRHTRFSSLAHRLLSDCLDDLNAAVPPQRIGIVTASVYGCVEETNATRKAYRAQGLGGVDPVQFSKSTHSYLANALSMAWGLRGPVSSLLGRRDATLEALWFAASMIEGGLADAMFVVAFDEIGECAQRHLEATASGPAGEACAVLCLIHADASQGAWRLRRLPGDAVGIDGALRVTADAPPADTDHLSANAALRLIDWLADAPAPSLELIGNAHGLTQRLCLQRTEVQP